MTCTNCKKWSNYPELRGRQTNVLKYESHCFRSIKPIAAFLSPLLSFWARDDTKRAREELALVSSRRVKLQHHLRADAIFKIVQLWYLCFTWVFICKLIIELRWLLFTYNYYAVKWIKLITNNSKNFLNLPNALSNLRRYTQHGKMISKTKLYTIRNFNISTTDLKIGHLKSVHTPESGETN